MEPKQPNTSSQLTIEGDPDPKDIAVIGQGVRLLRLLNCRSNKWTEIFQEIANTNISALQLPANRLADAHMQALASVSKLKQLDLSSNDIGPDGITQLLKLKHLIALDLSDNRIDDNAVRLLSQIETLQSLNIRYNEVTLQGARYLANLKQLKRLDVAGNKLSPTDFQQLTALLPSVVQ